MKNLSISPRSLRSVGISFTPLNEEENTQRTFDCLPGLATPNSPFRLTPKKAGRRLRLSGFSRADCLRLESMDQLANTYYCEGSDDGTEQGQDPIIMDPLDLPQERCPTCLPITCPTSLGNFLEQSREMNAQARKNSRISLDLSKLSTTTIRTPPKFVNIPGLPNLDIAEQLYREVTMNARNTRDHVVFSQLRFTEHSAEAYFVTAPCQGGIDGSGHCFVAMEDTVIVERSIRSHQEPVRMMNSAA